MNLSCDLRQAIDGAGGAELIAVSVRNDVAFDATTHVRARGTLFLLTEGLVAVETPRGRFLAPPRGIGWMPPGVPYAVQSYGPTAGFGAFLAAEFTGDLPAEPTSFEASPLAVLVMQRAVAWRPDVALDPVQMRLLLVLLDEIRQSPTKPLQLPWPTDARLLAIAREMLADVANPRRLEQWAQWADMSPRTLSRKFVQETGMTYAQWRRWARLTQALEWLATGRAVKHVALSLGYDSVSAFIKVFRETLGATPAAYFQSRNPERARDRAAATRHNAGMALHEGGDPNEGD
ncbi:MAG: AraC family transcriptional regulator [Casimicrobiaceae bacterium]